MNWLTANYKWLFDGIFGTAVIGIIGFFLQRLFGSTASSSAPSTDNSAKLTASPDVNNTATLNASPHIEQNVYIGAGPHAPAEQQPHDAEWASLTPMRAREVLLHEGSTGVWHEASTNLDRARKAIVLPFKNVPRRPGLHTPRASDVSASLVFKSADGSDEMHINHGVWLGRFEYSATFNSGVSHELLVALKDVPFVTFENPNSYNPFSQRHFRSGTIIHHPQMKTVWKEGAIEIVLVDSHNVTMFRGTFDYKLSVERMALTPKNLISNSKVHFVPDGYNCGWAGNDGRTDVRVGGIFTYEGEGMLTIVNAFLKDTKPKGNMMAQVLVGDGLGPIVAVNSLELHAHVPIRVTLNLLSEPSKFERGESIRGQLVLRDNYNRQHETDPIEFPWIGPQIPNPAAT